MHSLPYFLITLFFAMLLGIIPGAIARKKGDSFVAWWLFGTLLFIVALPLVLLLPVKREGRTAAHKFCPYCSHKMAATATQCPACNRSQPPSAVATQSSWEKTIAASDDVAKWSGPEQNDQK